MRRSRRRRWRMVGLAVLVLAVFGVTGREWLAWHDAAGGEPREREQSAGELALELPPPVRSRRDREAEPAPGDIVLTAAGPPPAPAMSPAASDRWLTGLRAVERSTREGALALAFAALAELRASGGEVLDPAALAAAVDALRDAALAELERAAELAAGGEPGRAAALVRPLLDAGGPELVAALSAAPAQRGWPSWSVACRPGAEASAPPPLAPRRRVRVDYDGRRLDGEVVVQTGDRVTVRLTERGLFPSFDRAAVEPVDANATEALDQAAAAIRHGDALLASLWLGVAQARGGADDARWRALAGQLSPVR